MAKFEPSFTWDRADKVDTLSIRVQGFKREQLKVQVDSSRNLRVSGQGGGDDGRQQFTKEFSVPEGCSPGSIRARFDSDTKTLVITCPKDDKPAAAGPAAKVEAQNAGQQKQAEPMPAAGAGAGVPRQQLGMRAPGRAMLVYTVVGVLVLVLAGACFYLSYKLGKATAGQKIVMGEPQ